MCVVCVTSLSFLLHAFCFVLTQFRVQQENLEGRDKASKLVTLATLCMFPTMTLVRADHRNPAAHTAELLLKPHMAGRADQPTMKQTVCIRAWLGTRGNQRADLTSKSKGSGGVLKGRKRNACIVRTMEDDCSCSSKEPS